MCEGVCEGRVCVKVECVCEGRVCVWVETYAEFRAYTLPTNIHSLLPTSAMIRKSLLHYTYSLTQ